MSDSVHDVTTLLHRWKEGDRDALDRLVSRIYGDLRALAHHRLKAERTGHTLDTTGLVNEALERLEEVDGRAVRVVEHRYFGGLTVRETAEVLDVSTATVERDMRFARAWLARELAPSGTRVP